MKIGLFFGSFNPVHIGHMIIANYMAEHSDLEQVWMVVSPHNPLKKRSSLANDYDRLNLVELAIGHNVNIKSSNIEFSLSKPSYTIDTLTFLKEKHPKHEFVLIMGGDNIANLHKWKNYEMILKNHEIYVYKRPLYELGELITHDNIKLFEAPLMQISSSYIRTQIKASKSIKYLVPSEVEDHIKAANLYR
jgi:nicotinate-nucleotide adenylyltransferase